MSSGDIGLHWLNFKNWPANAGDAALVLDGKISAEKMAPTAVFLPGNPMNKKENLLGSGKESRDCKESNAIVTKQ